MVRPLFEIRRPAEDTAAALKARYRQEGRAECRMRLQGLWLLRRGRSVDETAPAVWVHRRTVDGWVVWYRAGGLAGVLAHRHRRLGVDPCCTYTTRRLSMAQLEKTGIRTGTPCRR